MKNQFNYFIMYSNCIPVKGASRSTVCDLQRIRYYLIPNDLYDIISRLKTHSVNEVYKTYGDENIKVLDSYFNFLVKNNLGFFDDEPTLFKPMSLDWEYPSKITNSIIDLPNHKINVSDYRSVISELSSLNCTCLEFRCFTDFIIEDLEKLLTFTLDSRIKEIRLMLYNKEEISKEYLEVLLKKNKRVESVTLHNCSSYQSYSVKGVKIRHIKDVLSCEGCGQINKDSFVVNIPTFTESIKFNNCLNRKISIDANGEIKNCPSQNVGFGNISTESLAEVLKLKKFTDT